MQYAQFERLVSRPRLIKYLTVCGSNRRKAMVLYRANIRLSQSFFSVLSLFEVVLRNAVDQHYQNTLGTNWLWDAVQHGGFLRSQSCARSRVNVETVIMKLANNYTHDKAVAELNFGFWTNEFNSKEFATAGSTLLAIFPRRPSGINHTQVLNRLISINKIRNRIAHHEPICFSNAPLVVSITYALHKYHHVLEILNWMGIDPAPLFYGIDKVYNEFICINNV